MCYNKDNKQDEEVINMRNPLIITIGREYGSGGREIGELVAKTLGIAYYDKKLITLAAQKSGLSDEFIANNEQRVRSGFKAGLKLVWMLCLPIVALYLLGGRMLVNIFMNEPSEVAMASGVQFLRIVSPFYFVVSCKLVSDGVLRGAGLMKEFMVATFTDLSLRGVRAIALSKVLGVGGVWCAWPIGWSIAMVMSVRFYRRGPWEKA